MTESGASPPSLEVVGGITEEQSRFFLEIMVASAPIGLAFVDLDLRFVYINDTLAEYNGVPRAAHLGRKVKDIVPRIWEFIEPHYRLVVEQQRPVLNLQLTGETSRAPGVRRSWQCSYYPVRDAAGTLCGIGTVVTEVTEQRRAEEALRASERRYRCLVESMHQPVWTLNLRGEIVEPAPRWREFTGQQDDEYVRHGWLTAIHPDDRPRMMSEWRHALAERVPYQTELRLQRHDGLWRDVILRCVPVLQEEGSVIEWLGVAEDISARKRAERALQQATTELQHSEERYRTFINQSTEGIWRMELAPPISVALPEEQQLEAIFRSAYLAECNTAMAKMHGLQAPISPVGRRLDQFLTRSNPRDVEYLRAFIRSGYRLENSELRQVHSDGRPQVFLSNLVGVVEDGHLVRAWGTQRDVTEQYMAQLALESSQEEARHNAQQLRVITDALPALVSYVDRDERVLFCNQAHESWFGARGEQLVGRTVREIFTERYPRVREWVRRALSGETVRYEAAYTRKDGQPVYVQATYIPSRDARGEVQGFVAHLHDITDRKRAELELEAQRSRLEDILINCPAPICILSGPQQVFTLANPIFQKLSGIPKLLGTSMHELMSDEDGRSYSERVRRVYETGEPLFQKEFRARVGASSRHPGASDGMEEYRLFDILLHPLRDAQGQVDSVMSFSIDVTEQVEARQKMEEWAAHLSHQEQWLRSVLDVMPVALLLLEPGTGRVLFANQTAHRMAGGTFPMGVPSTQYGTVYELLHEDGTPIPTEFVPGVRAARGEQVRGASLTWVTPAGRYCLLIDSEILPAAHGHPSTVLLTLQDVSQLKHTQDQLQKAVQLRDEFLTVASHELRTPLTPLQLKLQSLMRDCAAELPPEQLRERVRKTAASATLQIHKLVELIGDLLDVSRLSEGRLSLFIEPVDLADLVREVAEHFESESRRVRAPLVILAEAPVIGFWDRLRLEQVVDNLLSNALKYGPGRPVTLRVELRGDRAQLTVSDEGIGIASESLPRIFEKFERAVSPRHYGGLGLGLYITRQVIHAMGGTIQVESQLERGATFTVELPLTGAGTPPRGAASAPLPGRKA